MAVLQDLKDPMGCGQAQWEVENLQDTGNDNWTYWADSMGCQISGSDQQHASGIWWPGQPGDYGLMAFKNDDYLQPFIIPGISPATQPQPGNSILPGEIKTVTDKDVRQGTRCYKISSPAGHGLFCSDIAGKEAMYLTDFSGAGFFSVCPGNGNDPKEQPNTASQLRTAFCRTDVTAMTQTSPQPGAVLKSAGMLGFVDLNGSGVTSVATNGNGVLYIQANNQNGNSDGPSIVLDAPNNRILLTAGTAQLTVNGVRNQVEVTRQIVWEAPLVKVEPAIQANQSFIQQNLSYFTSGGSPGSSSA
jgi:hypothetical protein